MVSSELQSLSTNSHSPQKQMRIFATSLLALNLASITGVRREPRFKASPTDLKQRKSRISQAEKLHTELITVS